MASIESFLEEQKNRFKTLPDHYSYLYDLCSLIKDKDLPDPHSIQKQTPDIFKELKLLGSSHARGLSYFWQSLAEFVPINFTDEDPEAQIKEIKSDPLISNFKLGYEYISLKMKCEMYDPSSNSSFNFGEFLITMNQDGAVCEPFGDNVFKDGFFHPYVSPDTYRLCLGDFKNPYQSYWRSLSFGDCWFFVKKVMTQYGVDHDDSNGDQTAPYARFSAWIGNQCVDCGDIMSNDETFLCGMTNAKICSSCAESQKDEVTGVAYMSHFIDNCEVCESKRFDVKNVSGKKICRSCRSAIK